MKSIKHILRENEKRYSELFEEYDPTFGIGSPIERFKTKYSAKAKPVYLPKVMKDPKKAPIHGELFKCGSIEALLDKLNEGLKDDAKMHISTLIQALNEERFIHDFEFWAITCSNIQFKEDKTIKPFVLRKAQRKLLKALEQLRLSGVPIRIVLLKARQWGGSTLVQIYIAWIQIIRRKRWHSAIVAHVEDGAKNIRGMFNTLIKHYPSEYGTLKLTPHEGSTKNKVISSRDAVISVASMESPDSLRSTDLACAHFSEVGLWRKTEGKKPEDVIQAVVSAVSKGPDTLIVQESTAKGVGNYFHKLWMGAVNKENNYTPVFVAWFEIEMYRMEFGNYAEKKEFIESMNEYEWDLWALGATLEGINWYRWQIREYGGDTWRMQAEYPSTAVEAFQSTGRRAFAPKYVVNMRSTCKEPKLVGHLEGNETTGPESLKGIHFVPSPNGFCRIWHTPEELLAIPEYPVARRFVGFADIGGRSAGADKSTIAIFDRWPMLEGGVPEIVFEFRGNLDQDLFAWYVARVGTWYDAHMAIEVNSLKQKTDNVELDSSYTVIDEIKPHFKNLYYRKVIENVIDAPVLKVGFHTNMKTKPMLINALNKAMREKGYVERSDLACDEMDTYEIKPDGSYGAVEGAHDDLVIVRAGGIWLCHDYKHPEYIMPLEFVHRRPTESYANF